MFEIRFHGRGGQGTVLAAKMLADAVLRSGHGECLAIPEFGVERRGAPVVAYARISDQKILQRTRIYEPDAVVLLDPTLIGQPQIVRGLKAGGTLLINTDQPSEALGTRWPQLHVLTVPASRIARACGIGSASSPVVNTAMLGAIAGAFHIVDLPSVIQAIRESVPSRIDANATAAREAYQHCDREAHHAAA